MKKRLLAISLLVGLSLLGCRSNPNIDLLERDLRTMEEKLYDMEAEISEKEDLLESCRRENKTLKKLVQDADDDYLNGSRDLNINPEGTDPATEEADPELSPPPIFLGPPEGSPESDTPQDADSQGSSNDPSSSEFDAVVTSILLNSRLTGGYNFDGREGDEGLLIMIEPRNKSGRYVPLAGDLEIVVLDPAKSGEASRIARWDFDSIEAARKLRKTPLGRGIHLELPWPDEPPVNPQLRVFVRYTTLDGRKLVAKQEVLLDLSNQLSDRWTPAASSQRLVRNSRNPQVISSAPGNRPRSNSSRFGNTAQKNSPSNPSNRRGTIGRRRPVWKPYR